MLRSNCLLVALLALSPVRAQEPDPVAAESATSPSAGQEVDFARDIAPIFAQNCVACHNAKTPEGGLDLENHEKLMKGGDSGDTIVPENVEESYLWARVSGAEEPLMPPEDNSVGAKRLDERQLELLKKWILRGAPQSMQTSAEDLKWQKIPEHLQPIYALESSADGSYLAFGHGNTVTIAESSASGEQIVSSDLIDPNLKLTDGTPLSGTHLDIVQSIAFSPDSQRVATGGFRNVKIWRRVTTPGLLLGGLPENVAQAAVSPDGRYVAYAIGGTGLELVRVAEGQTHRFLRLHSKPIEALAWLADGALLSSDASGKLALTHAETYEARIVTQDSSNRLRSLTTLGDKVFGVGSDGRAWELVLDRSGDNPSASLRPIGEFTDIVSIDGFAGQEHWQVVLGRADGQVVIADSRGSPSQTVATGSPLRSIAVSTDGSLLVSLPLDGAAQLWNVADGQLVAKLDRDYQHVQRLRLAERDATRQSSLVERLVSRVPELQTVVDKEVEAQKKVQEERDKAAEALAASKQAVDEANQAVTDTQSALTAAEAAVAEAMKRVESLTAELDTKRKAVSEVQAKQASAEEDLAKRDQALATANDSVARVQARIPALNEEIESEKNRLNELQSSLSQLQTSAPNPAAQGVLLNPAGDAVVVTGADHTLRVYAPNGEPQANLAGVSGALAAVAGLEDGRLIGLSAEGQLLSWDLALPWELEHQIGSLSDSPFSDRITALDFSPDGKWLAVGSGPPSRYGDIHLIDTHSAPADARAGKELVARDLGEAHSDTVLALQFSPDGRWLASGGADKLCRLFDVATGQAVRSLEGHTHHVLSVAWQDDGQRLATASADNTVKLWKTSTGEQERTMSEARKEVTAVQFVASSSHLVAVAADGTARLYNSGDGKVLRNFSGASGALFAVDVSDSGAWMATGGQAGRVWTWKVDDGKLVHTLEAPAP